MNAKAQMEYFGENSIENVSGILGDMNPERVFLVTGKSSYEKCGAKEKLGRIFEGYETVHFDDFSVNPKIEDIQKGIEIFNENGCDFVVCVGGGSVIDAGKLVNTLSKVADPVESITSGNFPACNPDPLVAIPTTAGSGSEATHFAVVYIEGQKYSLAHEYHILPDYAILDPVLTMSLSDYQVTCSGFDALTHAIESFISNKSTDLSKRFSKKAIRLILDNFEGSYVEKTIDFRGGMLKGANFAGKAINISKTATCHALSYQLTARFGIDHGQAVAVSLGPLIEFNSHVGYQDINDSRGVEYVLGAIRELFQLLDVVDGKNAHEKIRGMLESFGLSSDLKNLGIEESILDDIISKGLENPRMNNNPRVLTNEELKHIFRRLL